MTAAGVLLLVASGGCSASKETNVDKVPAGEPEPVQEVKSPADGVKQTLFAADVPTDSLPLSIAIETLGGVSTVLLPRGAVLPTEKREVFSTAADNQTSVEIHIVQGEAPMAKDNRTLGRFKLEGIPAAPRGVPQLEVSFAVDAAGVLDVSAKDLATNRSQSVTVSGSATDPLSKAEIERLVRDAETKKTPGTE